MQQTHGFFNVNSRQLYATLYTPDNGAPDTALVLCEPFAEEKRCAFRMLVRLAEALADKGVAVLRFDVSGTGDSCGTHAEALWDNWQEETVAACEFALKATGAKQLALAGFRSGALLASHAATKTACAKLCLVEPILLGVTLIKELTMRQGIQAMMNAKTAQADGQPAAPALPEGYQEFGGFVVSPAMLDGLSKADLLASSKELAKETSIQLIRVSGGKNFPPNWKPLVEIAQASPNGQATIIADKPFWGQVDYFESDAVINPIIGFLMPVQCAAL